MALTTTAPRELRAAAYLWTGQETCHDERGVGIACADSGQDADFRRGVPWPQPRFEPQGTIVLDRLTGLSWTRDAAPAEFPLNWAEAFEFVSAMNRNGAYGFSDWRLPNRRELRSLISHQTRNPALPTGHPFENVFLGWYWSSTTAAVAPAHAWYVHLEGARMFYGGKDQAFMVWPVRGHAGAILPATGQTRCFDNKGAAIPGAGTGQDGEHQEGQAWPVPRFQELGPDEVLDHLTGLVWRKEADLADGPVRWVEALAAVGELNRGEGGSSWRLPNINELESLVDSAAAAPALSAGAPFGRIQAGYWSSTTSLFEPDWAWALYTDKGAIGVGQKSGIHFHVWPVRDRP